MKSDLISSETKSAILEAAWRLYAERNSADISQADIAAAAGVTRQTVFYAFGNRTQLLIATLRHRDATLPYVARFAEISTASPASVASLQAWVSNWLDYLPHIYAVASVLHSAALTDPVARAAIDDRLVGALLGGLKSLTVRVARQRPLAGGSPNAVAEAIWTVTHVESWRLLVVECSWSAKAFRSHCLRIVNQLCG